MLSQVLATKRQNPADPQSNPFPPFLCRQILTLRISDLCATKHFPKMYLSQQSRKLNLGGLFTLEYSPSAIAETLKLSFSEPVCGC